MRKRSVLVLILCCVSGLPAIGQGTWNCGNKNNNHLVCLVPVATRATNTNPLSVPINSAFATELSQLPVLGSGPAIAVSYDAITGIPIVSDNLGPILTDRAETIGQHKLLVAFAYQRFRFTSIDGTGLGVLDSAYSNPAQNGTLTQWTTESVDVGLKLDQYVTVITFGLTKKIDISATVPVNRVSINSSPVATVYYVTNDSQPGAGDGNKIPSYPPYNQPNTSSLGHFHGTASGFGDVLANIKGIVYSAEKSTVAAGMEFRFPSGDALNYLGSGAYGFNPYAVWSYAAHKVSPHARLGYQFNTSTILIPNALTGLGSSQLPNSFQYNVGADYILMSGKRPATVAVDLLGDYVVNSPWLQKSFVNLAAPGYVYAPNPYPNAQPTLNPIKKSYNSGQIAVGGKYKPWKNLILYGNVTFQLNEVGLRSSPVPLVGASYTFF